MHQLLQALFHHRRIRKTYLAVLDGAVTPDEGRIDLPLLPDPLDRPRQRVDREHGKPAVTLYRVLSREAGRTRILFQPLTGRTHQLRIHARPPRGACTAPSWATVFTASPATASTCTPRSWSSSTR